MLDILGYFKLSHTAKF